MDAVENHLFDRVCHETADTVVLTDREIRMTQALKDRAKRLFYEQQQDFHLDLAEFFPQVRDGEI